MATTDDELLTLAQELVVRATGKRLSIGSAESCTGGMIAKLITDVPGSSEVFMGAVVSYDNAVKQKLLAVDAQTLQKEGAVSEAVALRMALGARAALGVDLAVSTTGVAGPGGGSVEKPVGTVWIGLATPAGTTATLHCFAGDRNEVRCSATAAAIKALLEQI